MQTVTVLERDEDGSPSAYRIDTEPEWDDEQVALLLALDETAEEIGPHGIPMKDAVNPLADANDRFRGWHYVPRVKTDHAQRVLNIAQAERAAAYPDEDAGSLLWYLERVEDGPLTTDR